MRIATRNAVFPLSVAIAMAATGALAQTAPGVGAPAGRSQSGQDTVEEVVVTGSLIARRDYVAESPIVTVQGDALEKSGAVTVEAALNQLPQFTASATASSNLNSRGGQANADLRGLGQQRTLVLLDGRRMEPSSTDGSIDLNTIPDALIDNVEIITGGASAVYGSDAISGVVNFKLKHHFTGVELKAQYGETSRGDGATESVSVTAGGNFADDRGNAVLGLTYANRGSVFGADRPFFAVSNLSANLPEGIIKPNAANLPSQSAVNSLFANYGIAPGTVSRTNTLGFNSNGTLFSAANPAIHFTDDIGNLLAVNNNTYFYNTGLIYYLQLPLTRYSSFARLEYELTPHVRVYAQGYYTNYSAGTQIVPPVSGGTGVPSLLVPYNNPFVPADLATLLASRPSPTAPFIFSKRMTEVGNRVQTNDWSVYQLEVGAAGDLPVGDLTWDVFATRGQTQYDETDKGFPSLSALQQLLNAPDGGRSLCAGGYNPFGITTLSPSCSAFLARTVKNSTALTQTNVQASVQGGLFKLPAGELRFAAGADYRENTYDYQPDSLLVHLDLVNAQTTVPSAGRTTVKEVFGELLVPIARDLPLISTLDADLAYRYSDYGSIGGVSTYKASLDWETVKWLRFRGGYQRAIRAPNLGELFTAPTPGSVNLGTIGPIGSGDPCDVRTQYRSPTYANSAQIRALCLAQGVPQPLIDNYRNTNPLTVTASQGNRDLRQETADTYSVGFVLHPAFDSPLLANTSFSVDYYDIKLTQAIGSITGSLALSKCFNADGSNPSYSPTNYYCSLVSREAATGLVSIIQTPLLNLGGYKTSGVDVEGDWKAPLSAFGLPEDAGSVTLNVVASYIRTFQIENLPGAPFVDYAGTIGNTQIDLYADTHPRWKSSSTLSYQRGPVSASVTWRFIDKMSNANNVGTTGTAPGVASRNYLDLDARWEMRPGLLLEAGVVNLADVSPPQFGTSPGATSLSTYDLLGRRFFVSLKSRF
jgi:iron complex outermembrane receptor protein